MNHFARKSAHKIKWFFSGYYNALLCCLILVFIFRPYERTSFYLPFWKIFFTATLISAVFNCNFNRKIKIAGMVLAGPAIALTWLILLYPVKIVFILNSVVAITLLSICTAAILWDVVLRARVTVETLRGVICAYFLVAFVFAYAYHLIDYLIPGTFLINSGDVPVDAFMHYFSEMIYFSFITLLTIGFGDVVPVRDIGQTAVVIEGILGQFYIAILVARIVSVYSFASEKEVLDLIRKKLSDPNV